jgi:hypothetical protein
MLAPISRYPFFQERHLEAPLFAERDLFLSHLESVGAGHRELSMKASYLLHIARIIISRASGGMEQLKRELTNAAKKQMLKATGQRETANREMQGEHEAN